MPVLSDLFAELISRLTPTQRELDLARNHRDAVKNRIHLDGVVEFINSGSYIKGTSVRPFKDIDLFVGFSSSEYDKDPTRIITRLRYQLADSFPSSEVRAQTHSIGILFSDDIRVDVVPGFALPRKPGFYRIRNRSDGRWVETNIELHKDFFARRQEKDPRFRDMVRLVKHWKMSRRTRYGSYLMELLVARAFRNGIPHGRDQALHEFFAWVASGALGKPTIFTDNYKVGEVERVPSDPLVVLDPSNWRNNVASAVDRSALEELISSADRARARSGTALQATSRAEASRIWRDLLPDFPAA